MADSTLNAEQRLTQQQWMLLLQTQPQRFQVVNQYQTGGTSGEYGDVAVTKGELLFDGKPVGEYDQGQIRISDDMPDGQGGSKFTTFSAPVQLNETGTVQSADTSRVNFVAANRQNRGNEMAQMLTPLAIGAAGLLSGGGAAAAGEGAGGAAGGAAGGGAAAESTGAAGWAGGLDGAAGDTMATYGTGGSSAAGGAVSRTPDWMINEAAASGGDGAGMGADEFYKFQAGAGETAAANPGLWQQLQSATGLSGDALMRLGTSLGLGAVSAMGPNSQTSTTQSTLDPATAARQQASWDNAMSLAQQPFHGPAESQWQTSLSGLDSGLQGTYSAQNQQNQMLGDAQGLVRSGTAGGTSAQNGLLGDVKSYLERATAAGTATTNPYAGMDNPYTQRQIDFATADLNRAYANNVAPKFAAGSSFGSSGLAQAEVNARNDLLTQQAKLANDMRYKDLFAQQQLGESYAGRNDSLQNLIRQLQSQGAGTLGSLGESAASRADSMTNSNLNRDLTGAGLLGNLSQIPVNTANTIFNQWSTRTNAADQNTNRAFNAWQMQYEDPFKRQAALQSATGTPTTTQTQTTPNGNAWSRGVGGAIAGAQMYNSLTGAQKKSSNLWGL